MELGQALKKAIENEAVDLQALIFFLVFEKNVLTMKDDILELDLYFKEKHNHRINRELHSYKKKINMDYGQSVYEIKTTNQTLFIYAFSQKQAEFIAYQNMIKPIQIRIVDIDELMHIDGKNITFRDLIKGKKPCILGGYNVENYQTLRPREQNQT